MSAVNLDSIPEKLKQLDQWVNWRYVERDGKLTKPPINPKSNGRLSLAKTNDPNTWSGFHQALAACQRHSELQGFGFCFWERDDLSGIDLDHVLNPVTGEIKPEATEVLERFKGTYTEISPSGDGFHIWCKGKAKRSGKIKAKVKWLEAYTHPSHRYLTVTGNHWPGSALDITNQQDALDWLDTHFMSTEGEVLPSASQPVDAKPRAASIDLDDAALIAKIRASKQGALFDRLWRGDTSGNGGDHSSADMALCNLLAFWTDGDAARIDRLFRQSGLCQQPDRIQKWDKPHFADGRTYGQATVEKAIADLREGYGSRSANASRASDFEAESQQSGENPSKAIDLDPYRGTDEANAALFLNLHGENVRYCPPWMQWLLWTGSHWRIDDRLDIRRLAADLPRSLYRKAADIADSKDRGHVVSLARGLESTSRQNNFLTAAQCRVVVHHSDLDKGHFLLNALNGTVDLLTGKLREHRRADLLTHDTAISYHQNSACPTWQRFLADVFQGDADLIAFIQRAIGYSLTGSVSEQVLLICYGSGSNGKSVFLNILRALLGTLALQAAPDLLMADRHRRHPTEQADLFGKRLVVCQETAEGRRFNEVLVKQLTGGDAVRARRMHENFWEFAPTHKLWLSTNHRPEIRGTDHAIWRRVRLIPFNVQFTADGPHRKDANMEEKLLAELPGILTWAIHGCLEWQRDGLGMAEAVKTATETYRNDMDILSAWLSECCITGKRYEAKASALYKSYTDWCEQAGENPESQRRWGMRLTERGLIRERRMVGFFWIGIGLPEPSYYEPNEPNEPEKASFESYTDTRLKYAKSGSYGSYRSCPPSVDKSQDDDDAPKPKFRRDF